MSKCFHLAFRSRITVAHLGGSDVPNAPPTGYVTEIEINCADCGVPFQFKGIKIGLDMHGAGVSLDRTQLRAAITPQPIVRPKPRLV